MPKIQKQSYPLSPNAGTNKLAPLLSVKQFCAWAGFSRWKFNNLKKAGAGPRCLVSGRRILISQESALAWLESLESGESPAS